MNIDDIVNLRYGPSPIRVEVRWDGGTDEGVKPLTYKTKLSGVRGHDLTVTLPNQLCKFIPSGFEMYAVLGTHLSKPSN